MKVQGSKGPDRSLWKREEWRNLRPGSWLSQRPSLCLPDPTLLQAGGPSPRRGHTESSASHPSQSCQACLPPSPSSAPSSFPGPHPAMSNLLPLRPRLELRAWPGGNLGPSCRVPQTPRLPGISQTSVGTASPQEEVRQPPPPLTPVLGAHRENRGSGGASLSLRRSPGFPLDCPRDGPERQRTTKAA